MSTLTGSFGSPSFGGSSGYVPSDLAAPSAETLRTMHADGIRLARGRMMIALAALVPILVLLVLAPARQIRFDAVFLGAAAIGWALDTTLEWWRTRRQDPLTYWQQDQREQAETRVGETEKATRIAATNAVVTLSLTGVVIAVTAVQFIGPGVRDSVALAALVKPDVYAGEVWRLITAAFLHASLGHLSSNVGALIALGTLVETYDCRSRVALAFVAGALCGNIASTVLVNASSLGASGGILGIAAYLLASGAGAASTPMWMKRELYQGFLLTAAIGIFGFFFIDNAAHVGGALGGFAVGRIAKRANERGLTALTKRLDACGWIAAALLIAGAGFTIGRLLQVW